MVMAVNSASQTARLDDDTEVSWKLLTRPAQGADDALALIELATERALWTIARAAQLAGSVDPEEFIKTVKKIAGRGGP